MDIIAITVSTNYSDLLCYVLNNNYKYFKHWIFITDENDKDTIELINQCGNTTVLFFNFRDGGRSFNKGGAMRKGQEHAYQNFPNDWYLNIDSDICLENNFKEYIDNHEGSLLKDCIYGTIKRNDYLSIKDYNNRENYYPYPLHNQPLGFFQLYKEKVYYTDSQNCGACDIEFLGHFYRRQLLDGVTCNHLGNSGRHWQGRINKADDFIH
jgi:hypothetical protein